VHNSPSPTLDIYVNDTLYLDDFAFLDATAFELVPAGVPLNIQVAPETSTSAQEAVFSVEVTLENGENYIAIAHGIVNDADNPFSIALTSGAQLLAEDPSQVELLGFHGIPGAPTVALTDYVSGDTLAENLSFGEFTDSYLGTAAAPQAIELRVNGSGTLVGNFFTNLSGLEGLAGVLMAGGLLDSDPLFNLYLVTSTGIVATLVPVTDVQLIHNSPSPLAATVDVYNAVEPTSPDDFLLDVDDFAFRDATPYGLYRTRLPITFGIAPGTSTGPEQILFELPPVTLSDGKTYSVIANGLPGDADFPFGLAVSNQAQIFSSTEDQVGLLAFHGSPGAPNVDVDAREAGLNLYNDLAYGSFVDYLEVGNVGEFLE